MSDDSDLMISRGSICTSHGGLAIYINEVYKHKFLPLHNKNTWEGLFIEIEKLNKKIILGNVYRNENYQSFIKELVPIFNKLDNNKCEIVLTDDFNINSSNKTIREVRFTHKLFFVS